MKKVLFIALLSNAAFAKNVVVQGNAAWNVDSTAYQFTALEQLGVEKSAENDAVTKCQNQGLIDCVILGANITKCSFISFRTGPATTECDATANARGIEQTN